MHAKLRQLSVTPQTEAHQAPLSVGILQARILEWVAIPLSRDLQDPRIEPRSSALQADSTSSNTYQVFIICCWEEII